MVGDNDPVTGLKAALTCPMCAFSVVETIPADRCVYFYECPSCHMILKSKPGECCVFCSYGDKRCPFAGAREAVDS